MDQPDCARSQVLQPNAPTFLCLFQDKVTKEVNFILANQETIQSQITHLDDAIKQMEVNFLSTDSPGPSRGPLLQPFGCLVLSLDIFLDSL